jgi:hypothetical protein
VRKAMGMVSSFRFLVSGGQRASLLSSITGNLIPETRNG